MYGFSLIRILKLILIRASLEQLMINQMVSKIRVVMSTNNIHLHSFKIFVICKNTDFEYCWVKIRITENAKKKKKTTKNKNKNKKQKQKQNKKQYNTKQNKTKQKTWLLDSSHFVFLSVKLSQLNGLPASF